MCIVDEIADDVSFRSSYERGRPMPLTRGATSKVILANLPARRLNKLLSANLDRESAGAPKQGAQDFRAVLGDIKKRGYCVTRGEVDRGKVGLAAPVVISEAGIYGSLSLVAEAKGLDENIERRLILLLVSSAGLLAEELRRQLGEDVPRNMNSVKAEARR
jgi:DNA-binding IclR family transcriptional regulator